MQKPHPMKKTAMKGSAFSKTISLSTYKPDQKAVERAMLGAKPLPKVVGDDK